MSNNSDQSAFPLTFVNEQEAIDYRGNPNGLTKRELFAGMAMQGMLSNKRLMGLLLESDVPSNKQALFVANSAVEQADALLSQLEKK